MEGNKKLSNRQIKALVISTIVGVGILSLPNSLALANGNDGWIPIIIAGLLTAAIVAIIGRIFDLYPDKDFFQIGRELLGNWLFTLFLLIFSAYLIGLMSFLSRSLAELVRAFLLDTTPTEVIIITFILVTSYIAREEINIIGRLAYHIYPLIIVATLTLVIFSLPSVDFTNILPLFQSKMSDIPKGIRTSFFSFVGYEILFFSLPYSEKKDGRIRAALWAIGLVVLIYLVVFFITLAQYGEPGLKRQVYPTLSLVKEIDLPGFFVENLDGVAMAGWVLMVFSTMAPSYYSAAKIFSHLFGAKDHRLFVIPLLPIVYIVSLLPQNTITLVETLGKFLDYTGLIVIVLLPVLMYVIGLYRLRRKKR
ncbi:MAG: endospore germination permease [Tissierellaceae bacterium]